MNIGVDIDGVLQDTEHYFRVLANIYDIERLGNKGVVNPEENKIELQYNWDKETFETFINDYMYYAMENAPIMLGAKEVLTKLKEMGHNLILITARGKFSEREKEIAYKLIEREGLNFDVIRLDSVNKLPVCLEEKIDYMIDDMYSNVMSISEGGVNCLYFRDVNRKKIDKSNVFEVNNWGDVYRFFVNVDNKK